MPFKINCLREDYRKAADDQLDRKAIAVKNGLTTNAANFPAPPVGPTALGNLAATYTNAYSAYKRGGLDQKPAFQAAQTALLNAMDDNADYVDRVANGDSELIVEAGYVPTKASGSPIPAPLRPEGVKAERGQTDGEILVECPVVEGAEFYGLLVAEGTPFTTPPFFNGVFHFNPGQNISCGIDVTKSRKKKVQGLTPGTLYYFYMYAGNANGISALSSVVQQRA